MSRTILRVKTAAAIAGLASTILLGAAGPAQAASSKGCENGGFRLVNLTTNATVASAGVNRIQATFPASQFGTRFAVRGRYAQFEVRSSDFAVYNQAFTGAPNALDLTGGRFTPVFASKIPNHRGLSLSSGISVQLENENLSLSRTGTGLSMTLSAKDCAQGGIFQMEPERADGTRTRIVHTLATSTASLTPFYFDNPNFRARIGQFLGSDCTSVVTGPPSRFCVQVTARTNIANGVSAKFVARDSASGGRMGFVTGEDSVEVANPPTNCVTNCQAQNRVKGRLVVLGFPFPVPAGSRLTPRTAVT
jgi:hypothetical protein